MTAAAQVTIDPVERRRLIDRIARQLSAAGVATPTVDARWIVDASGGGSEVSTATGTCSRRWSHGAVHANRCNWC